MLRAVQHCNMAGKLSLLGEYNIWNMALSVNCYDLRPDDAFRVSLHVANAGHRPTQGDLDGWLVKAVS
jgi:hypothetical protein